MSRLSFTTMGTPGLGVLGSVKAARKYGFGGVDIRVSDHLGELPSNPTDSEIYEIKSIFNSEGIKASGLLCYNEHGGKDKSSWHKMKDSILMHIEIGMKLGTPSIRLFTGNPDEYGDRYSYSMKVAELIAEVLQESKPELVLLFQNHNGGCTANEIIKMVKHVGNSKFGMVYSPDHTIIQNEDFSELEKDLKYATRQLYVADSLMEEGRHKCMLPGKGVVPITNAYKSLGGDSFEGWVTFKWEKIWNKELESFEIAFPYFMEYWNSILL